MVLGAIVFGLICVGVIVCAITLIAMAVNHTGFVDQFTTFFGWIWGHKEAVDTAVETGATALSIL